MVLSRNQKTDIKMVIGDDTIGGECLRCGNSAHITRECDTTVEKCWQMGKSKEFSDKEAAEELYQYELKIYDDRMAAKQASKKAKAARTLPVLTVTAPSTSQSQDSTQSPRDREETPDSRLGDIDRLVPDSARRPPPAIQENGVYNAQTTGVGLQPNTSLKEFFIMSNYVKVNKIPSTLYVYSLDYWRPNPEHPKESASIIEYSKVREIKGAFEALTAADALNLQPQAGTWATNFKDLWSITPLPGCPAVSGAEISSTPFVYTQINGKTVHDMRATLRFQEVLDDMDNKMKKKELADLSKYISALNANVAQCVRNHHAGDRRALTQVGANKFFVNRGYEEMTGLRAVRGYFTSIRPGEHDLFLNVNTVTSAFLPPISLSDLISQMGQRPVSAGLEYVEKMLHGALVRIIYRRANFVGNDDIDYNSIESRTKKFTQFGSLPAGQQKFFRVLKTRGKEPRRCDPTDEEGTTVLAFLKQKRVTLPGTSNNDIICVNVGNKVRTRKRPNESQNALMREQSTEGAVWIPACLLEIMPYQAIKTTLGSGHTTQMIDTALRLPAPNAGLIDQEGLDFLGIRFGAGVQPLAKMGFQVDSKLIRFAARTLASPPIFYGTGQNDPLHVQLASWNLQLRTGGLVRFSNPKSLGKLHVLGMLGSFDQTWKIPHRAHPDPNGQLTRAQVELSRQLTGHGMKSNAGIVRMAPTGDFDGELAKLYRDNAFEIEDCTLIVIKQKCFDAYAKIKRRSDLEHGKHSLCVVASKIQKSEVGQLMSNLALKINLKVGGDNHHLATARLNALLGPDRREFTIILGADVAHPGAGVKLGSPSIACVVGSVDKNFMNYPGSMRLQMGGQEHIEDLRAMVRERIEDWKTNNPKSMPTSILFYRDGISESQFKGCEQHEVSQVKDAFVDAGGNKAQLQLTFVVVGKRHNTRFYPTQENQAVSKWDHRKKVAVSSGNLKPGLFVEHVVTNPLPYNFFLQSHDAIKGTARAAHYHMLLDGMGLRPNLPELTHMLCYAFGRATKGVSYVAPAYIADRLCERGRAYLRPWNTDSDMLPKWDMPKDSHGKVYTRDMMESWKRDRAGDLSRTPGVWGINYNGTTRFNPWHPNLDKGMFWM